MPLDLSQNRGPIDEKDRTYHDVLAELQGNILAGHGRNHAVHLFIAFDTSEICQAKSWIAKFANSRITSALTQAKASAAYREHGLNGGTFAHLALSAMGYKALGFEDNEIPSGRDPRRRASPTNDPAKGEYSDVFKDGLAARQSFLFDPPQADWEDDYQASIHAMVLLADDDPAELAAVKSVVVSELAGIATIVATEQGMNLKKSFRPEDGPGGVSVEHFGYVDGRSQPLFLERQLSREAPPAGGSFWDPRAPLSLVLVPDPNGAKNLSFGSFLVYRKLEQNVQGFRQAEAKLSDELGLPEALVGAMAVGRYKDGTPVVLQPGDGARPIPNDFNYSGDPQGRGCPFHAHTRKTNPRLESVKFGGPFAQSEEEELGHRIARRGIPYGGPLTEGTNAPSNGVGLLFFCYQSDIWEQFEFMQRFWSNNPGFLESGLGGAGADDYPTTGLDAVIGQKIDGQGDPIGIDEPFAADNWPKEWGKATKKTTCSFAQFVRLMGGEYLFSPSIGFLKSLG